MVQSKREGQPFIDQVVIKNQSRLSPKVLEERLSDHTGKPLNATLLESDIANIYGFDSYETVDYQVVAKDGNSELHILRMIRNGAPTICVSE